MPSQVHEVTIMAAIVALHMPGIGCVRIISTSEAESTFAKARTPAGVEPSYSASYAEPGSAPLLLSCVQTGQEVFVGLDGGTLRIWLPSTPVEA